MFPFHLPIPVPLFIVQHVNRALVWARIRHPSDLPAPTKTSRGLFKRHPRIFLLPINFVTAPLIAVLFLLAVGTIGRDEVRAGTLGANHIVPIDIMVRSPLYCQYLLLIELGILHWPGAYEPRCRIALVANASTTQAYIAISIDTSGLIRFLAFVVVKKGGSVGHRLYLYLYVFFFGLGTFVGNVGGITLGSPRKTDDPDRILSFCLGQRSLHI